MLKLNHLILLCAFSLLFACSPAMKPTTTETARQLHERLLTIDTHADTPLRIMGDGVDPALDNTNRNAISKVDFPRMKQGGLDAIFFAVFIGQGSLDSAGYDRAQKLTWRTLATVDSVIAANPESAVLATSADEAQEWARQDKRAIYLGLENGFPIAQDIEMLPRLYKRGIRYVTLCHMKNNDICDSSTDTSRYGGLSAFGIQVVEEMNRLGMMVDVSHTSDATVSQVLELSKAPIIASHSNARQVRNVERNLPDSLIKAIGEKDGVIQVCALSYYVKPTESYAERDSAKAALKARWEPMEPLSAEQQDAKWIEEDALDEAYPPILAMVADLVDHIDHIVAIAGIDHVGIGTDFDGGGGLADCYDVSELPAITAELLKRGYSEADIAKIWSGNLMRVFRAVESVSENG